jgi:hypothetical protein
MVVVVVAVFNTMKKDKPLLNRVNSCKYEEEKKKRVLHR